MLIEADVGLSVDAFSYSQSEILSYKFQGGETKEPIVSGDAVQ